MSGMAKRVAEAEDKPNKFKDGQVVDVKKLVSSNDPDFLFSSKTGAMVPMSIVDGKYVLVCSFTLLVRNTYLKCLETLLYSQPDLLQIVLLLDLDHNNNTSSFFHSLPFDFLTIPFSHDFDNVSFLALHPSGLVLQTTPLSLYMYGSESFPFTRDNFDMIDHRDLCIQSRLSDPTFPPMTLDQLLLCDSLPLLSNLSSFKPTSSLCNKPVGLYLYYFGDCLDLFLDMHQQCLSKGLDFEFILVPIPFSTRHPVSSVSNMIRSVLTSCPNSSWLTFPFDDKICRTLWRLYDCLPFDQLLIMPHAGLCGDLEGKSILRRYGIQSYPFTTHVILEKKLTHLRSKTLQSLLGDHHASDIRNKNVVLYFVNTSPSLVFLDFTNFDDYLERKSYNIRKLYEDTQIYTVPLGPVSPHSLEKLGFKLVPEEKWESLIHHIFMTKDPLCKETRQETIVTFGKDGKVLSRYERCDIDFLTAASRFEDQLSSQIWSEIQREIDIC